MKIHVIKTEEDYSAFLEEAEGLVLSDPETGTKEAERLELLSLVIETYENDKFPIEAPTPIEAIMFRMEEQGLRQRDLVPFLGHKSKVSEVLSGKRSLSLPMIKSLHENLGIPLKSLIGKTEEQTKKEPIKLDYSMFPFNRIKRMGWLDHILDSSENAIKLFVEPVIPNLEASMCRKSDRIEARAQQQNYAIYSWIARLQQLAESQTSTIGSYSEITDEFMLTIPTLSVYDDGPLRAKRALNEVGIILIIARPLPESRIDGAVFKSSCGTPIIGMSLRYDRKDNFWYTLLHELAHLRLHFNYSPQLFIDDTEHLDLSNDLEKEANDLASDSLIPRRKWRSSVARRTKDESDVKDLAAELGISPAIVAGRIRFESNDYRILSQLIGQGSVKELFIETGDFYE